MAYLIKKINIKNTNYIVRDDGVSTIIDPINDIIDNINNLITDISNLINNISERLSTAENKVK